MEKSGKIMDSLVDVMVYLIKKYPYKDELSNARLTKMVYLADWKFALKHGRQITDTNWVFNNYGPFVRDILNTANQHPDLFTVEDTTNSFGAKKTLISLLKEEYTHKLSDDEKEILDYVINTTKDLNWDKFIQLVYSTFPILTSERYSELDLIKLAQEKKSLAGQAKVQAAQAATKL
ncbi:Panacea domain-containing protein [Methanocalculus sp. MC3]